MPPAYHPGNGAFYLQIGTGVAVPLTSFAGCFDKVIGVEYEDCHLTVRSFWLDLLEWIGQTRTGQPYRDLTVFQLSGTGQPVATMGIGRAFLRSVAVSDFDAAVGDPGSIRLVVVPATIESQTPISRPVVVPDMFTTNNFRLSIAGTDLPATAAVRGLRMTAAKLLQPPTASRRVFLPGPPEFADIVVDVTSAAYQFFDSWVADVTAGNGMPSDGTLTVLSPRQEVIQTIDLYGLLPTAFPLLPTGPAGRRSVALDLLQFRVR